jgi:hypothetical protein
MSFGGVTVNISDEGIKEHFSITNPSANKATRRIRCAWADRIPLIPALLGGAVSGSNAFIIGQPYPYFPGSGIGGSNQGFVCAELHIEGDGLLSNFTAPSGDQIIAYQRAVIDIIYRPWIYDQNGIATQRVSTSSNVLAVDTNPNAPPTMKWGNGDPMPPTQTPALTFTTTQITIERLVGVLNLGQITSLSNHRNNAPLLGLATDKVIFWGIGQSVRSISVLGASMWQLDYNMEFNPYGWNKLFRPDKPGGAGFDTFKFQDGSDLYPAADLSPLIT